MRRALLCSLLAFLGGTTTANFFPRSLSSSAANFATADYDYVIIGGGTAGLVVAARLSEDPKVSVGIIEAGQYLVDDPLVDIPQNAYALQGNPKYDWLFKTTPQPNLKNRVMNLPRGRLLGGSSGINIMAFDRASKAEYDAWGALGSPGWSWNDLLPFMRKAERFTSTDPFRINSTNPNPDVIYPSQGTNGPVAGSYNEWYSDVTVPYGKAMVNAGVPANYDPDSGNAYGHFNSATSINRTTGKRSYAASTYYAYHAARPNLSVLTGAQVTKINFANTTGKSGKITASGVSFVSDSTTFSVRARKEVILSAGSLKSPQLLELSGIGNTTILKRYGIQPLIDLPGVGENLQDHPMISATYELKPGKTTLDILRNNATYAAQAQAQYASTHDGIYATTVSIMSFVNLRTFISQKKLASMTAQLDKETATGTSLLQRTQYAIQRKWLAQKLGHIEIVFYPGYYGTGVTKANTSYVAMLMVLQHPFSRGNVHINTSDPLAPAVFNPNYFSKSFDPDSLVEALKFSLTVSKTEPLASSIVARQDPAPNVTSDADILDYARNIARTLHHPIGTVALAPRALGGVVSPNLKVYGTENLRVVDASIIPLHMGTHLQRSVYGIGEKASAMIKSGH